MFMENPCSASSSSSRPESFPVGLRVLVVDDDPTWLKILEKMLRKCSYEVTTCGLARDALDMLRERKDRFDIVISDVNMPDMDGFKLLEHVGLEMDLPVIMMSVDGETSRVMKGVQHGACDYLLKPVRMKELRNIWQHVYRKKIHEVKEIESHDISEEIQLFRNGYDDFDERQFLSGCDQNPVRKRKEMDKEHSEQEYGDSSTVKKARVVWSVDLHQKFVNAVNQIGFDIGPKKILDLMNVPGITRENVASHLQKYRLYLSRLQKQNEVRTSSGNMQSHINSRDLRGSLDVQSSIAQERKSVTGRYTCATQKIQPQGICADVQADDVKKVVSLEVADRRKTQTGDSDSQKLNSVSQLGMVLSFKGMMSNIDYKQVDPATSKHQYSGGGIPLMQFIQCPKGSRENFVSSQDTSSPPLDHDNKVFNHMHTQSSVMSITCSKDREILGLSQVKPLSVDFRNSHVKTVSPVACKVDSVAFQLEHDTSSLDFAAPRDINGSTRKDVPIDQNCNRTLIPPSQDFSLKHHSELASVPEDLYLYSLQSYGYFENLGLSSMGFFEFADSTSSDGLDVNGDHLYDSFEYPLTDECLFT